MWFPHFPVPKDIFETMWNRFFIILLLFSLTFFLVLPILCHRLKYSIYYGLLWPRNITEESLRMIEENNQRLLVDRLEFTNISTQNKVLRKPDNFTDIVITVITVSRQMGKYNPYYLTQTVGKLLQLLRKDATKLQFTYGLMLCNVDSMPNVYMEARGISKFLHTTTKYIERLRRIVNRFEKEKRDYVYCLEKSLQFQPKYVLLMEDDAYPTDRMLPVLEYSVQNVFEGRFSEFFHERRKVAYLKLYHPERLLGFISSEIYRLFELVSAIILLLLAFLTAIRTRTYTSGTTWRLIVISGIYILFLALAIGRPNLISLRRAAPYFHSFVTAPSCCTPANLYSYAGARMIIDSLSRKVSYAGHAKDALLDEFLQETGCNAIYVEPNIFKHIGQYSSLRQGKVLDPYVV